ncbi:54S ribosomal protein L7 [Pseudovirgaria hyperparasitica]|uniref:54S ribosomal protein L7 n=1 Tax=Pseudovirgaria hyperparasitica TaxID=470096 RepID=A0A6A6W293_9PEZI|nr:54S ribosomal protein L7 [Pseudovirgaria hyperparasitica]KAF2756134.1 54S ribosomal protein L7 [Pseudovirgaria hyperparasitica]
MALREAVSSFRTASRAALRPLPQYHTNALAVRYNSTAALDSASEDLEPSSSFGASAPQEDLVAQFDPLSWSRGRKKQLPPSRYRYRPPKYYRGPLHPNQPPPESDPASRAFRPGPFMKTRLEQTHEATIAADYMTLVYQHYPPGTRPSKSGQRLREWVGDSPYFENRPLRAPRGGTTLSPVRKPITFRNVPRITGVTVHSFCKDGISESAYIHVASMIVQSVTNVRCQTHESRTTVQQWAYKARRTVAVKAKLDVDDAHDFLGKTIDMVMPKIKDYSGVSGTSGDSCGNISFGFTPEQVAYYPEVEAIFDQYPPQMIPGFHVTVHTSAVNDRDARLLLEAYGIPFYGKHVN